MDNSSATSVVTGKKGMKKGVKITLLIMSIVSWEIK